MKQNQNHWFWKYAYENKGVYIQGGIATFMVNLFAMVIGFFVMVVYDRVVPNQAIESLIALTIGVLIALGFDFLIKTLRANFIDRAGKRADTRMSRIIFDQLTTMNLATKREKSGALDPNGIIFDSVAAIF